MAKRISEEKRESVRRLRANGASMNVIAKIMKISKGSLNNILKEKSLALEEMQEQLAQKFEEGTTIIPAKEATSVELPPIVVKQEMPKTMGGLRGEVIAVNEEEKFIIIDIGENSGVKPGIALKVVRADRDIALVEVLETRKEISAADIRQLFGQFSIQEGDSVVSQ